MSQHFTPATFHFNRPHKPALSASTTASEDDRALVLTSDTSATGSDVHPVELVVQSVVGPLLDSLSGKLGQLQESQLILVSRLKILERQLDHYDQNVSVVDSAALASRVQNLKARLNGIVKVLKVVEKRVSGTLSLVEDRKG